MSKDRNFLWSAIGLLVTVSWTQMCLSGYLFRPVSTTTEVVIHHRNTSPRIFYQLLSNNTFQNRYNPYMRCKRKPHPSFGPMLDFSVRISTDLKILFLGDSVSVMTAQMYQELAIGSSENSNRSVIRYSWGTVEGTHLAKVDGGGIVAGWRITGWMLPKGQTNNDFPNIGGGRWMVSDVPKLMNETRILYQQQNANHTAFDALVLRIPHGWMKLQEINRENMIDSLKTAQEKFGFKTAIITTLPFVNNIQNPDELGRLESINTMIRDFAATYQPGDINGVDTILTLDFDRLVDELVQHNGRILGYNETEIESKSYLFDQCCAEKRLMRSRPVICAALGEANCQGNGFARDGMHWCNEALNGRLGGGISCLLSCVYDHKDTSQCAKKCNEQFMSLAPMDLTVHSISS